MVSTNRDNHLQSCLPFRAHIKYTHAVHDIGHTYLAQLYCFCFYLIECVPTINENVIECHNNTSTMPIIGLYDTIIGGSLGIPLGGDN